MAPPAQWLPGWIRWPLRVLLWPYVVVDVAVERAVQRVGAPAWRLAGRCDRSGACCLHILAPLPAYIERVPPLRWLALAWFTQVHGFYERGFSSEMPGSPPARVLGCRYLRDDRGCAHYHLRPGLCRRHPQRMGRPPAFLPGCGYRLASEEQSRLRVLP